MKRRKEPLTSEEEHEICRRCGGFCCKYYFFNVGEQEAAWDLHKFRKREIITYGKSKALVLSDKCPYSNDVTQFCDRYDNPNMPKLCKDFPERYRPFWNLRCELMRKRYARGMIPKDVVSFSKLRMACKPKEKFLKCFK